VTKCSPCGLAFAGTSAFDAHRVGVHAYTWREGLAMEPPREDGRRCLQGDELEVAGLALDDRGRWHLVADARRARRRFAETHERAQGVRVEATEEVRGTSGRADA
jgi:hypothetical protein